MKTNFPRPENNSANHLFFRDGMNMIVARMAADFKRRGTEASSNRNS